MNSEWPSHIDVAIIARWFWRAKWSIILFSSLFGGIAAFVTSQRFPPIYQVSVTLTAPVVPGFPPEEIIRDYHIFFHRLDVMTYIYDEIKVAAPSLTNKWSKLGFDKQRFLDSQLNEKASLSPIIQFRKTTSPELIEVMLSFPEELDNADDLNAIIAAMNKALAEESFRDYSGDKVHLESAKAFHAQVSERFLDEVSDPLVEIFMLQAELKQKLAAAKIDMGSVESDIALREGRRARNNIYQGFTFDESDQVIPFISLLLQRNLITGEEKQNYLRKYFQLQTKMQMGFLHYAGVMSEAQTKFKAVGLQTYLSMRSNYTLSTLNFNNWDLTKRFEEGSLVIKQSSSFLEKRLILVFSVLTGGLIGFCSFVLFKQSRHLINYLRQTDIAKIG